MDAEGRCTRTGLPAHEGPCGTKIDRYQVVEWLGGGGMGAVYRARHTGLGRDVALKLLRAERVHDADAVQRFLREAKATAAIRSPHVVEVRDFGVSAEGHPFLVMELVAGRDLESHLARSGRLGRDDAVGIVLDVLAGLEAAHAAGVVHRDLKASNVLLGDDGIVRIVDFGLAKLVSAGPLDGLTRTGAMLGTPMAMSPEQARNAKDVDARTDLWAVGVLLYRALAGRPPFVGSSYEDLIVRISTESPPPLSTVAPAVPAPLAAVVARALERDPAARFQSAGEMSTALRKATRAADLALTDTIDAANAAAAPPPAPHDDDDEDEERERERADRRGPSLRPSLAFVEPQPRRGIKLPLALAGFLLAAGGLIAFALVLRPTVAPPAPIAAAPSAVPAPVSAPLPPHDPVLGVEVLLPVGKPAAPVTSVAPEPSPPPDEDADDSAIQLHVLESDGPLPAEEIEERLRRATSLLSVYRAREPVEERAEATIYPNGTLVIDRGAAAFWTLPTQVRFRPTERPTRVRLQLLLLPRVLGSDDGAPLQ